MASPNKTQKTSTPREDDLQLPINKTNPLVYVGIGVVVLLLLGGVGYATLSQSEKPSTNVEASIHSARVAADQAKAKQQAQLEHLELTAKAWAVASEQERAAAAASAAAAAEAEAEKERTATGSPGAGAKPKKGPSGSDLDQLDKLGSAVNSELGGP